jgi:ribosome recycling factor
MEDFKKSLDAVIEHLREEITSLRTGRATPALVEDLAVEYYGSVTQLKAIAAISSPEPRQLVIQPWDKNALAAIEQAIVNSSLGMNPIVEGILIRLSVPALTEERRREMTKLLGKHVEAARIRVRQERDEVLKGLNQEEKNGGMGEDEVFRQKGEIQKSVDAANARIEEISQAKEKEIMTI